MANTLPIYAPGRQARMARLLQSGGEYATGVVPPAPFDETSRTGVASPAMSPARWMDELSAMAAGVGKGKAKPAVAKLAKKPNQKADEIPPPPIALAPGESYVEGESIAPEVQYEAGSEPMSAPAVDYSGAEFDPTYSGEIIPTQPAQAAQPTAPAQAYSPDWEAFANAQIREAQQRQYEAQNPKEAARFAGVPQMAAEYQRQQQAIAQPSGREKFGRFLDAAVAGIPEGSFGDDTLGRVLSGATGGYSAARGAGAEREGQYNELGLKSADQAAQQAVLDAIMKRGQDIGGFMDPEADAKMATDMARMEWEQQQAKAQAAAMRDQELSRNRQADYDYKTMRNQQYGHPKPTTQEDELDLMIKQARLNAMQNPRQRADREMEPSADERAKIMQAAASLQSEPQMVNHWGPEFLRTPEESPESIALRKQAQQAIDMYSRIYPQYVGRLTGQGQPAMAQQPQQGNDQADLMSAAQMLVDAGKFPTLEAAAQALMGSVRR